MTPSRAVLIVDDSMASGCALGDVLRRAGIDDVEIAASLQAALECLANRRFGLVIADYLVGDATGLDVRSAMQTLPDAADIAFILLSNRGAGSLPRLDISSLTKPVNPLRLRELVIAKLAGLLR